MTGWRETPRTLVVLVALAIANHIVLAGNRVAVSLEALRLGASAAIVGVLLALYAFLPMLCAVAAGRLSDRVGVRRPMMWGSVALAAGSALPAAVPGMPVLFVSAALVGLGFMLFQVASQNAAGEIGTVATRAHNFSVLALGYSISGFLGPLIAGFTIDHGGFALAFAVLALLPLVPVSVLAGAKLALPGPHPARAADKPGSALALVTHEKLRRVFFVNVLLAMGWDLHTIVIPVYGATIGLTASQVGLILSSFAAATFVVRVAMPWIVRRFTEHEVLTASLFVAAAVYGLFPFWTGASALMASSFTLGLGLGMSQPMVMALLHRHAPPGRMGEAAGVRISLVNAMAVAVPLAFGALGATVGLPPVFWSVAACLATGGWLTKRER